MNEGKTVMELMAKMQETIEFASSLKPLASLAERFEKAVEKLGEVGMHMFKLSGSEKIVNAFAFAHPFLEAAGDVTMAWFHLWRAAVASKAMENGPEKKEKAFYEGVIKSAEFFIRTILPVTRGRMEAILDNCGAAVEIDEDSFGGR